MVEIGNAVPKISLVDTELKQVDLSEASRGKATILAFFPGAFTGVCTKELCTFRDSMGKFNSLNGRVYAISVDSPFANKGFKDHNNLNFPILSDYRKDAVKAFGIELNNFANLKGYTAAKRSVFIADSKGTIKYKWVSDDPTVEPKYAEIEAAMKNIS